MGVFARTVVDAAPVLYQSPIHPLGVSSLAAFAAQKCFTWLIDHRPRASRDTIQRRIEAHITI